MARLCYRDATGVQREVPLSRGHVTIGRHPEQDIQILDRVVSKEHCVIEFKNGRYSVRDAGSRNGTYVNGILISSRRPLAHGDEVSVGSTLLKFIEDSPEDSLMSRVTFHESGLETNIRSRLTGHHERGFLPEREITDVDALRQDYEKLRIAVELQESIGLEVDEERLLSKVLDKAFQIFPADRGVILLRKGEQQELLPTVVKSRNENENESSIRISQTILREVQEEKTAVLSNDAMMDSRFSGANSIILERIRSTMSVPLLFKDRLLGVIHLDSQIASGAFTEKDLQILTGFAAQAAMALEHSRLVQKMEKEVVARENMARLLSPQLVDEVVNGRLEIQKGGTDRSTSILFADIRGFTAMSERINARQLVNLLNAYFEVMVDVIFNYEGTLDKFVGDEIMALWNAPLDVEEHALKAVTTALRMMEALGQFNEARRMEFELARESGTLEPGAQFEPVRIGIGINTGHVVAGYVGSSKSLSYTAMGDPVNTASRMCSFAGPGDIIIGRNTFEQVKAHFKIQTLEKARLKGKAEAVEVFKVLGFADEPAAEAEAAKIELPSIEDFVATRPLPTGRQPTEPYEAKPPYAVPSIGRERPVSPMRLGDSGSRPRLKDEE